MPDVLWYTIADLSTDHAVIAKRGIGWGIAENGWKPFVRDRLAPELKKYGLKRVLLHLPFGKHPDEGGVFQFDQFLAAKKAGLKKVVTGFATAFKPLTKSGTEAIAYIGMMEGDKDFDKLAGTALADDWLHRAYQCIKPLLDAGCSLAFDVASWAPEGHPLHRLVQLLVSLGVKVYVEPRPLANCPHWFETPVVCENGQWLRSDPGKYADASMYAPTPKLAGEVIRLVKGYDRSIADQKAQAAQIAADGHTLAAEHPYFDALLAGE